MVNTGAPTNNTASTTAMTKGSTTSVGSSSSSSGTEGEDGENPQQGPARHASATVKTESMNNNDAVADSNNLTRVPPSVKDLRKLFVGGLPQDVTSSEFRAFFEKFGAVDDSVVMVDRETSRSRGFGFVTFQDASVTERVLAMGADTSRRTPFNGSGGAATTIPTCYLEMRGKRVEIKAAEPKINPSQRARVFRKGDNTLSRRKFQPTVTPDRAFPNIPVSAPSATAFTSYYQQQQQQQDYQGYLPDYHNAYSIYGTDNHSSTSATAFGYDTANYYYPYYYNYPQDSVNVGYFYHPHPRQHSVAARPEARKATSSETDADNNGDSTRNRNQGTHQLQDK